MENLITWLERQIELCDDLKSMEKEKWAFIQTLKKVRKKAINYTRCCKSDSELLAEHKCRFYVNADWSYLRCDCGKRIKPSEG